MPLVTSTEMFKKAYEGGYAIGAFNVNNMEIIQGVVGAAMEEKAPLILQVSSGARKYANTIYLKKMVEAAVEESGLPICLHLDHGDTFELCKDCVDNGFTSVMIDASHHSFEENIKITRSVVEYAHDHGVHRSRSGSGIREPHRSGQPCNSHRHQPRSIQIQRRTQTPLRYPRRSRKTPPRFPYRFARSKFRSAVPGGTDQRIRRQYARS